MSDDEVKKLIDATFGLYSDLRKYTEYPPVYNSRNMLKEISLYLDNPGYIRTNKDRLNVGLLAAKSLDFDRDELLYQYATQLHAVWHAVLILIGQQPFEKPKVEPQKTVFEFYAKQGYLDSNGNDDVERICNHMTGIDFSFSVNIVSLPSQYVLAQWKLPIIQQGDYYAEPIPVVSPDCLGINSYQAAYGGGPIARRIEHKYKLNIDYEYRLKKDEVKFLQSVAAAVLDTWSVKGYPVQTSGGCTQYFNSKDRNSIKLIS